MFFPFYLDVVNLSLFSLDSVNFTVNYHLLSQTNSFKNTFLVEPLSAYIKSKTVGIYSLSKSIKQKSNTARGEYSTCTNRR